jgi:hypothetical protein
MKYILLSFVFLLVACSNDPWTKQEKSNFKSSCREEGGSKKYCNCLLENTMSKYPRYEESKNCSFEEMVELSKDCK